MELGRNVERYEGEGLKKEGAMKGELKGRRMEALKEE